MPRSRFFGYYDRWNDWEGEGLNGDGRQATVDSCVFLQGQENVPGYHLELAEEQWVTVRWDWVEEIEK